MCILVEKCIPFKKAHFRAPGQPLMEKIQNNMFIEFHFRRGIFYAKIQKF
jgi:hypothetical protein